MSPVAPCKPRLGPTHTPANKREQRGRFGAEHLVVPAQKLLSHLKAMRDHEDNLCSTPMGSPQAPCLEFTSPSPWLSLRAAGLSQHSSGLTLLQLHLCICHHAGQQCLDHTGRIFVK